MEMPQEQNKFHLRTQQLEVHIFQQQFYSLLCLFLSLSSQKCYKNAQLNSLLLLTFACSDLIKLIYYKSYFIIFFVNFYFILARP